MNPLVSIIIPTYNRVSLIRETLDSIGRQTYTNWECILVDDSSTDNTAEVIEAYLAKDSRFKLYSRPMDRLKGANACRNYGFEVSKGDYINWFDSDDLMHPKMIEKKINVFLEDPTLDFVSCKTIRFEKTIQDVFKKEGRKKYSRSGSLNDLIFGKHALGPFFVCGPMYSRAFLKSGESFNETLKKLQDWEFMVRQLAQSPNFKVLDDELVYYRQHFSESSRSHSKNLQFINTAKSRQAAFEYLKNNGKLNFNLRVWLFEKQVIMLLNSYYYKYPDLNKVAKEYLKEYFKSRFAYGVLFAFVTVKFLFLKSFKKFRRITSEQ